MRDIGKNIRDLRERSGLTQEALAEKLFVTRQTVSNYETGKTRPDLDMLIKIAETLGTDANTVLYGIPTAPEKRRTVKRTAMAGGIFLALLIATLILAPIAQRMAYNQYRTTLHYFLNYMVIPGLWALGGFSMMETVKLALNGSFRKVPGAKWIRLGIWCFWGVCLALVLPHGIVGIVSDFLFMRDGQVSLSFSMGTVLDWLSFRVIQLARYGRPVFLISGILFSLLCSGPGETQQREDTPSV